ncbi:hypothetical protein [Streptomyces sp. NPDC046685]|uniref:hypothetical protein n=1 Tax=Streptomyces sp. NPDC046685 TaxID=3157202 RepID=UPI0033D970C3
MQRLRPPRLTPRTDECPLPGAPRAARGAALPRPLRAALALLGLEDSVRATLLDADAAADGYGALRRAYEAAGWAPTRPSARLPRRGPRGAAEGP